jgi:hypothetical protein
MFQKKKVLVIIISSILVIGASAGAYFWHSASKPHRLARLSMTTSSDSAGAGTATVNAGGATPLNVNSSDNLGQLGMNLNQTASGGQSAGASSQGQSNSSSSSNASSSSAEQQAEQMMNPTTFSQYDTPLYLTGDRSHTASYANLQLGTGTEISPGHMIAVIYKGCLSCLRQPGTARPGRARSQAILFLYSQSSCKLSNKPETA